MKKGLRLAEVAGLRAALVVLRCLPPVAASNLGGGLARWIGPFVPVSRIADRNLQLAMPDFTPSQRRAIIRECWDNIGRTVAELPHIGQLPDNTDSGPGWRVEGLASLTEARASGKPVIFFSGHIGNWELMPLIVARFGLPFASFYRAASNPMVDRLIRDLRRKVVGHDVPMFPKGAKGAREALRHLTRGGHLGLLGDQKMNDGIEATLFGRPAMTASAAAVFALRHQALIVTGHVQREGAARFVLKVDPPFSPQRTDNHQQDVKTLTQSLNDRLEGWIREKPGAWLWLHRRWDKALYRRSTAPR